MQNVVPNNVASCCVEMLQAFRQAFRYSQKTLKKRNIQVHCGKNMTLSDDVFVNGILNKKC